MSNIKRRVDNLIKTIDADTESLIVQYRSQIEGLLKMNEQKDFFLGVECFISLPPGEPTEEALAAMRKVDSDEKAHNLLTKIWARIRLTPGSEESVFAGLMMAARPDEEMNE